VARKLEGEGALEPINLFLLSAENGKRNKDGEEASSSAEKRAEVYLKCVARAEGRGVMYDENTSR